MNSGGNSTALLVMDMQLAVIRNLTDYKEISGQVAKAIELARLKNIIVIFVKVSFRPGMPEISMNNKIFAASKERSKNIRMDEMMRIDDAVAPAPGEIVVTKLRVSAFAGSDLEIVLRAQGIQNIVLTGVATSGVVLSTLCEASDRDYRVTVIADCCTDADVQVHEVLTGKVFPRHASVVTLKEWSGSI